MFTLPVNRNSTVNLIVPGKKQVDRTWKLTTVVQAGIVINYGEWIPGDKSFHLPTSIFTLEILVDGIVLSSHTITNSKQIFIDNVVDTDQTTDRVITFRITGKDDNQPIYDDTHSIVRLYFCIEDLEIKEYIFEQCEYRIFSTDETKMGSPTMGENGELIVNITTPIYTWLLSNEKLLKNI